jgi:hypothetical protein
MADDDVLAVRGGLADLKATREDQMESRRGIALMKENRAFLQLFASGQRDAAIQPFLGEAFE